MSFYTKEVMKHFQHPKNMGKIENADGIGEAGSTVCGDLMRIYIKVKSDKKTGKEKIINIKFECLGCVAAIANTSLLTTMVKGKFIEDALKIDKKDILKGLGGVPVTKIHCSILATEALNEAIYDYYKKSNRAIPMDLIEKHKKTKLTIKDLEKRHAKYIEFERNVLKNK